MSLCCGGCVKLIGDGYGLVYRFDVLPDGSLRRESGDYVPPNCAICDRCWGGFLADGMTRDQADALAARGSDPFVFAWERADSGRTSFGTKEWSSIEADHSSTVFLPRAALERAFPKVVEVIEGMARERAGREAHEASMEAGTCGCSSGPPDPHGFDVGLMPGARATARIRRRDGLVAVAGTVLRHHAAPEAAWHLFKPDEDDGWGAFWTCSVRRAG